MPALQVAELLINVKRIVMDVPDDKATAPGEDIDAAIHNAACNSGRLAPAVAAIAKYYFMAFSKLDLAHGLHLHARQPARQRGRECSHLSRNSRSSDVLWIHETL